MDEITLIFPNQLFEKHPALDKKRPVILAEEFLFFRVQHFHKQRLVLFRAAMKHYASWLTEKGFDVIYINSSDLKKRGSLFEHLHKNGIKRIFLTDFDDDWLQQDLDKAANKYGWKVHYYPSPSFLCTHEEIDDYFDHHHFSMSKFYADQRRKRSILMQGGSPIGGKFSFDTENRKKVPKKLQIPDIYYPRKTPEVEEAIKYVDQHFPEAVGNSTPFNYPVNFVQAKKALELFIEERLTLFGDYEDAICQKHPYLFHSVLSPILNLGLLTPKQILEEVLSRNVPLNSLEGFVRQIMGWREYIRAAYKKMGNKLRTSNHFKHHNPLPKGFLEGTTGIIPIDHTIKRVLELGYCHHIERLMVLGNFLILMETNPTEVCKFFTGYFVDAYDWVMVPNVYAMSQYADHGTMTTKPYISGSNYILKMSDYPKGEWTEIWDGLFWRFFENHLQLFRSNPRINMLASYFDNNEATVRLKIQKANEWQASRK